VKIGDYDTNFENAKEKDNNVSLEENDSSTEVQSCWYCKTQFSSTSLYAAYVQQFHQPNPNDPNFYFQTCNYSYKNRGVYRGHLRYVHDMELPTLRVKPNLGAKLDINGNSFY
jgi:hypothetical protein